MLDTSKGVDTSNLTAESDFFALKAEVRNLEIDRLVNVSTSFNSL